MGVLNSKCCYNGKPLACFFYLKTKISADFQNCISVPLRRKANRNFRGNLLKNHFIHLKCYSNPPRWLSCSRYHMSTFWKRKGWSSNFWEGQPFAYDDMGVYRQRRLKSTKTGISTKFRTLAHPETKHLVYFLWEKDYMIKLCGVKA